MPHMFVCPWGSAQAGPSWMERPFPPCCPSESAHISPSVHLLQVAFPGYAAPLASEPQWYLSSLYLVWGLFNFQIFTLNFRRFPPPLSFSDSSEFPCNLALSRHNKIVKNVGSQAELDWNPGCAAFSGQITHLSVPQFLHLQNGCIDADVNQINSIFVFPGFFHLQVFKLWPLTNIIVLSKAYQSLLVGDYLCPTKYSHKYFC